MFLSTVAISGISWYSCKNAFISACNSSFLSLQKTVLKKIEEIGVAFTHCLHEGEITQSCVHKAKEIASSLAECIQEQRQCVAALDQLVDHDEYVFHHSIRVAMYATAIALEMGLNDPVKLKEVALGGIVHDIGKSKVPESIINKNGPLTDEEQTWLASQLGKC